MFATRTDRGATEWRINDDVVRLREWGTEIMHRLPEPPWDSAVLGTAETCSLQLVDPSGYTSREHARLERGPSGDRDWILRSSASSLSEIEKGTRRLLAIRQHDDNIAAAARALGMAPVSLARWIGRRALPERRSAGGPPRGAAR